MSRKIFFWFVIWLFVLSVINHSEHICWSHTNKPNFVTKKSNSWFSKVKILWNFIKSKNCQIKKFSRIKIVKSNVHNLKIIPYGPIFISYSVWIQIWTTKWMVTQCEIIVLGDKGSALDRSKLVIILLYLHVKIKSLNTPCCLSFKVHIHISTYKRAWTNWNNNPFSIDFIDLLLLSI